MVNIMQNVPDCISQDEQTIICKAVDLGISDEIAIRNYFIREEFKQMKLEGLQSIQAIEKLMRKYELSWSRINGIIYP